MPGFSVNSCILKKIQLSKVKLVGHKVIYTLVSHRLDKMEKVWKVKNNIKTNWPEDITRKYHPVILRLLQNRGIISEEDIENFFEFSYENLTDPKGILGMDKAVSRIKEAKEKGEKIAIFGDYDADGVTATAIILETFLDLGITNIIHYIPDRQLEGYGMNEKAVDSLYREGVKLIITVDCGITNIWEVQKARELGMDVIVTDHHHIPSELPEAVVCINCHLPNTGFKYSELAGVGVAFKLAQALYGEFNPGRIDQLKWALDLVAIGTVADCVPLLSENRTLVKYGSIVLSKTKRVGLLEMFQVGRIQIDENNIPDAHKIAFQVTPRINAAGRMDHANAAYFLIREKDRATAHNLAIELEGKNQERQKITAEIVREIEIIANNAYKDKKFIFAENEHWPVGILGLVAGKICEEFSKPTIILQKQEEEFVGSLRSVAEVNIMEVLTECKDLLNRFGGHAQAAGVTISKENIEKFYERFSKLVSEKMESVEVVTSIDVDMEMTAEDLSWELAAELKKMEPFGQGNPEPVFLMKDMPVSETRIVGNGTKHLKLALRPNGNSPKIFDAIGFCMGEKCSNIKVGDKIDIVFNLKEDEWNGNRKIQLKLVDLKLVE